MVAELQMVFHLVYDWKHYFDLGPIPKPKLKLADTFGQYHNQYQNHISNGKDLGLFSSF